MKSFARRACTAPSHFAAPVCGRCGQSSLSHRNGDGEVSWRQILMTLGSLALIGLLIALLSALLLPKSITKRTQVEAAAPGAETLQSRTP